MILGASVLQLPAILKAKEFGLQVIAVDIDPNAIGFKYADMSLLISTIDTQKVVHAAIKNKINGIMTLATDLPVRTVAAVARRLNLVGISEDTALLATDKAMMRNRFKDYNIPIPEFHKTDNLVEYLNITRLFKDNFIVKPVDNSGSRGVYWVRSKDDAEKAFTYAKNNSRSGEILIEEFMTGREISVETLSVHGEVHVVAITDKLTTGIPNFVEMGHSQPAQFNNITIDKIMNVAKDAIRAIGIKDGASHVELMITNEGPKIIELGARLGGDCITSHLVPLSTGIDMVGNCIKIALNEEPDLEIKFKMGSAIRYLRSTAGRIKSINGIEMAAAVKGICNITIVKNIGDIVNDINNSNDRVGFVIAQSNEVFEAIEACENAMNQINIDYN